MQRLAPQWLKGAFYRPYYFQPTFYKHQDQLCSGVQFHVDHSQYQPDVFKPYRAMAVGFKAIRNLHPDYQLWRDFPYEYVFDRLAIDVITGCDTLRKWVDDKNATVGDLEKFLERDEKAWKEQTHADQIYR